MSETILTPQQVADLVDAILEPRFRTLVMLAAVSGAREGELLGLKWQDVDFQANQIRIERTFTTGKWSMPKNHSIRDLHIDPQTMAALTRWRRLCPATKDDLVFPGDDGRPMSVIWMLGHLWHPARTAAGLGKIRFHCLRDFHASWLAGKRHHPDNDRATR